ncbi:hypothetical protein [Terriglobus roseus]|nr:hypothetical protein [Terriglobus roseus]
MSKRLPAFLNYVVHESLTHSELQPPKERTLGVEVFGRKPDYDTNADPIVRVTATELRKKLAQYYYADGHDDAIRIELPPGSYLPKFHRSTDLPAVAEPSAAVPLASSPEVQEKPPAAVSVGADPLQAATLHRTPPAAPWRQAAGVLAGLLIGALLGYLPLFAKLRPTPIARFWTSFAGSNLQVRIVMPVIGTDWASSAKRPSDVSVSPNLSLEDTNIAARVAGQLEKSGQRYLISPAPEVNFADLRTGPAVLIGALDNVWTLQLSKDLPFVFQESADGRTGSIVESKPDAQVKPRIWSVDITTPHQRIGQDYGIVARYKSPLTGQPAMVIAGISSQGTQAAGEVVTIPSSLESALRTVTNSENFEVVIQTTAVGGRAGPPTVIASKTW